MNSWKLKVFLILAVWLTASFTASSRLLAQSPPAPEKQKIEALIKHVGDLKDARFIRNGKEYDVDTAVRFLRGKWKANDKDVKTARDFVDKVASASSTSGKPYHIRFKNGREIPSREFLLTELSKLESLERSS